MSFHPPPQPTMAPPPLHVGPQGGIIPGYLPPSTLPAGLPPPPMPPPFPGFAVPPPGQTVMQPSIINSAAPPPMQTPRPPYSKKPNEGYEKKKDQFRPISSDKPTVTVFVGNITEHASDALIRQLLMKCGIVVNWKRVQGADGKLQAFGFCEYIDPEAGLRAIRLLHNLSVGEKNLVVKVDAKTKAMLEEYKKNKATEQRSTNSQSKEVMEGEEELDEATLTQDAVVKKNITGLLTDNADVLSGKFADTNKWKASHSGSEENLEGMGMDKDKKHLISREIRFFRDAYKDSEKDKKERGKDDKDYDKERKERDSDRDRDRERDRERDRDRGKDRQRERDRSQEKDSERSRNDERSRDRSRSRDRDRGREDRDKGRQTRDRELDEDELYEKRKRERKLKERNQAFVERLKTWEARERKKIREYDRELEKERERENEQSREKKHLLEFLEDYDDERDDPKYYRGGSFDRRLQARLTEMEADDKDRQKEHEEIEEIRKRLGERAVEEEEAEEEESTVEVEPEARPTLQATFKPAIPHVVEAAPNVSSPAQESPKNSPTVNTITKAAQEESGDVDGETATKKTFGFEMKTKPTVGSSNPNRKKLVAVFNSEEDSTANQAPKRKLVPLDYSEEEMKAVGNSAAKTAEEKKKSIKSLIERIPTAKDELFAYSLDWECVDQTLIDRRIRPWVNKKIVEYIGEEEPSLVDFMCSKLLARSQPENILRDVSMVLDDEAEVFVVKMWRLLIYETEAKKIGLVK